MKLFKRKTIRLLCLLTLPLSLIAVASRVKSAAEFPPPCRDEAAAQISQVGKTEQVVTAMPQKVVSLKVGTDVVSLR